MMVAAHKADLDAAAACGLHTAFVPRPQEMPPGRPTDLAFEDRFDFNANDFHDLAAQLGC